MARPSKYAELAEKLYSNAGLIVNKRNSNRISKITSFLKSNSKNATNAVVFTDSNKLTKMKKYVLVGKTNARNANHSSIKVYAGIK
jgi:hypothetical protein